MSRMLSYVLASFLTLLIANGQTPVTTPAPLSTVKSLTLEAMVPIDGIDAAATPNIPADLLSSLTSGTMELRQQLTYDAAAKTLKVVGLSEPAGSALPTPTGAAGVTTLFTYTINVSTVLTSSKRGNSVLFLGTVADGAA